MSRTATLAATLAFSLLAVPGTAGALDSGRPAWPDTPVMRLAALALVQSLNAELLSGPSATLTLDRWCDSHDLAPAGTKVVANRARDIEKPADASIREALGAGPDEIVAYRRVKLTCGSRVLSEADNWYLPSKLTEEMNRTLQTTDTAFGRVVRPLGFTRSTMDAELLWHPLPDDWATAPLTKPGSAATLETPPFLLRHRAILKRSDGVPFSMVVESYTSEVLAFPPPALP